MTQSPVLQLNIKEVLDSRVPKAYRRWIPGMAVKWLERFIRQDRMNEVLWAIGPATGLEFAHRLLDVLNVSYTTDRSEHLPANKRVLFVSNHPLGALDGMVLLDMVSRHYKTDNVHFVVNDLLSVLTPLADVFVPVNKHGAQSKAAATALDRVMDGDGPVLLFPAGLVSRRQPDGSIADLKWNKMFVNKAIAYNRDIVPLFFEGHNTDFFYNMARWRQKLGLKFNFEMLRLPAEMFDNDESRFTIRVGTPIRYTSLSGGLDAPAEAAAIRQQTIDLSQSHHS